MNQLRERLSRTLPDYMVPSAIVVLDALPLNANGKVDRQALPQAQIESSRTYEAPQGEIEQRLAAIWAEVLGVAQIGRQDHFFELGGNSISVLKVQSLLQKSHTVALALRSYFEHPTLAGIAQIVAAELGQSGGAEADELAQMAALMAELEN